MSAAVTERPAARSRPLPAVLAGLLLLTAIAYPLTSDGALRDVVSWTIVLLGAALSVVHAGVSRGRQTGVAVLALVAVVAIAFEAVGLGTGFPYGSYTYSDQLGPTLLGVPFLVPLAWLMMAWPSWVVANVLTRRRLPRILVATYVFAAWDVLLDPQMVDAGYWTWAHPEPGLPGIDTVPLTNLAGWLLAGLVLMTLLDAVVAATAHPGPARISDAAPLVALAWMTLGGALAHVGWLGLPGSAAWGVVLALPVLAAVAIRRTRRAR
jgi:putative membrane protein